MTYAFPTLGLSETWWTFIIAVLVLPSTFVKDISCVAWQSLLGVASLAFMAGALAWFPRCQFFVVQLQTCTLLGYRGFSSWDGNSPLQLLRLFNCDPSGRNHV